jgi:hypothetical protein
MPKHPHSVNIVNIELNRFKALSEIILFHVFCLEFVLKNCTVLTY